MIVFRCPRCQHSYSMSDRQAGHKFACGVCGQRLQVPPPPPTAHADPNGVGRRLSPAAKGIAAVCAGMILTGVTLYFLTRGGGQDGTPAPAPPGPAADKQPDADPDPTSPAALATRAHSVLKTHCYRCHGENGAAEGGLNFVLDLDKLRSTKRVLPGDPDKSRLFRRVRDDEMPPDGEKPRPTAAEVAALRDWIAAGAPALPAPPQPLAFVSTADLVEHVHAALIALPERHRRFARFFTLTHLANAGLGKDELQTYRAALSKLVNSLSWNKDIVPPAPVDPSRMVFRIDIRDYQWSEKVWKSVLDRYPYGILWDHPKAQECYDLAGGQMPFVRADWFVAHASRPPLYHDVLQLPMTEPELEKQLHIDIAENVRQERVARAGFNGSGVSQNNRLIERHPSPYGAYWRSYDFADNLGRRNLFAFPLGPGGDKGFQADGGEVIFSLPNGLNAFLLVDEKGKRIDRAPLNIVSDPKRPDRAVENGISCMSCHARGLLPKNDQVWPHVEKNFPPQEHDAIKALYPEQAQLDAWFAKDNARFRDAVTRTGGKLTSTEALVGLVSHFEKSLDLTAAAAELGLTAGELSKRLGESPSLARALGPLRVAGGTVQRQVFTDAIPDLVKELKLGTLSSPAP